MIIFTASVTFVMTVQYYRIFSNQANIYRINSIHKVKKQLGGTLYGFKEAKRIY